MRKKSLIPLLLVVFLACDKEDDLPSSGFLIVQTKGASDISDTGITFSGSIVDAGKKPILDHGFVWSLHEDIALEHSEKVSLGEITGKKTFSYRVDFNLYRDSVYYVKAFATNEDNTVYGNHISFVSKGSHLPVIDDFTPSTGTGGDTVTIHGKYFSAVRGNNIVRFGTAAATLLNSSTTVITVIVPEDIADASVPIKVAVADNITQSANNFLLKIPVVENFLPTEGTFGDIVTITGKNFDKVKENNVVSFNEHPALIQEATETTLKVVVPGSLTSKSNKITIIVDRRSGVSGQDFSISPPVINSILPLTAKISSTIEIRGRFHPQSTKNIVWFGDKQAQIVNGTATSLFVKVPDGKYPVRSQAVSVAVFDEKASGSDLVKLIDPWLPVSVIPGGDPRFGRWSAAAFSIGNKGYVGLGNAGNRFWSYDRDSNSWTEIASYPGTAPAGNGGGPSFVINGIAYLNAREKFCSYDPSTNIWTEIAGFPSALQGWPAVTSGGKAYFCTGSATDNFWEYDPSGNTWTKKSDAPTAGGHFVFVLNNKLYLFVGGIYSRGILWEYDPNSSLWTKKSIAPFVATGMTFSFFVNGSGYISNYNTIFRYDPSTNSWKAFPYAFLNDQSGHMTFELNGKIYLGAGWYGHGGDETLREFDPLYE